MRTNMRLISLAGAALFAGFFIFGCRSIPVAGTPFVDANQTEDFEDNTITIEAVVSVGPGWLVIHNQQPDGVPGDIIGYAPVHDGINQNVTVKIDPAKATATLIAELHRDAGTIGTFEFPGPDTPVLKADNTVVMDRFQPITSSLPNPSSSMY